MLEWSFERVNQGKRGDGGTSIVVQWVKLLLARLASFTGVLV